MIHNVMNTKCHFQNLIQYFLVRGVEFMWVCGRSTYKSNATLTGIFTGCEDKVLTEVE